MAEVLKGEAEGSRVALEETLRQHREAGSARDSLLAEGGAGGGAGMQPARSGGPLQMTGERWPKDAMCAGALRCLGL